MDDRYEARIVLVSLSVFIAIERHRCDRDRMGGSCVSVIDCPFTAVMRLLNRVP
jgi:hypothetical protein